MVAARTSPIVHNDVHHDSFARVTQNKVFFSTRRWNPIKLNVLCLPEVIGAMVNKDREDDATVSYIARSGKSTIIKLSKNTPTFDVKFAAPPLREIDLNFGPSVAGHMIESIITHLNDISA